MTWEPKPENMLGYVKPVKKPPTWNDLILGLVTVEFHPDAVHVDGKPITMAEISRATWLNIAKQLTPEQLRSLNPGDAELWTPRDQWVGLVSATVADFVSRLWLSDTLTVEENQRFAETQVSPLDWQWLQTVHGMTAMLNFRDHLHEQVRLALEAWVAGGEERERLASIAAAEREEREAAEAAARESAIALARQWMTETKPNPSRERWLRDQLQDLGVTRAADQDELMRERLAAFRKEPPSARRFNEFEHECPGCGEVSSVFVTVST